MQQEDLIKTGERLDDLQIQGYKIIQNPEKFCFGMDAVLLSSFVRCRPQDKALDLGTGTGIIPILLAAKTAVSHIDALEIQPESADMANRSIQYNHLEERIHVTTGDICETAQLFPRASFDVVTTNPPYMNDNHGLKNPDLPKAIARHEVLCTLNDVVQAAADALKPGGHFFMVHRPFRLVEIINTLSAHRLETKRMRFVHSYADKEPNMVLIEAVRGGNSMVKIESPLVVYQAPGVYTQEIYDIYNLDPK